MKNVNKQLIKDIKDLFAKYQENVNNNNILHVFNNNENWHTEVLAEVLKYSPNNIKSFLKAVIGENIELSEKEWRVDIQKENIDCLLSGNGIAVIIENKIFGALDQTEQLNRYIDQTKKNFSENNIYVIYLTKIGGSPSSDSFPDKLREKFRDRYREINYKEHIYYWLKDDVLPSMQYRSKNMILFLELYLKYLGETIGLDGKNDILIQQMQDRLKNANYTDFNDIKGLKKQQDDYVFSEALDLVMTKMIRDNVYVSPMEVRKQLKKIIKDDADNFETFSLSAQGNVLHLENTKFRIHINCTTNEVDNIKTGPYILFEGDGPYIEATESSWNIDKLKKIGFEKKKDNKAYCFPFKNFDPAKTPLPAVAEHIRKMIEFLNDAQNSNNH